MFCKWPGRVTTGGGPGSVPATAWGHVTVPPHYTTHPLHYTLHTHYTIHYTHPLHYTIHGPHQSFKSTFVKTTRSFTIIEKAPG